MVVMLHEGLPGPFSLESDSSWYGKESAVLEWSSVWLLGPGSQAFCLATLFSQGFLKRFLFLTSSEHTLGLLFCLPTEALLSSSVT
jgi:hypothetical protein